jgi:hypothetical protein
MRKRKKEKIMKPKYSRYAKFIIACLIGVSLVAACSGLLGFNRKVSGSGNLVEETRTLQDFTEVVLSEEGDLFIEPGIKNELVIEAEHNLQQYLIAETVSNVLDIKKLPENVTLNATKPIRYYLTVKELESLTVKNSGNTEITGVDSERFSVRITGSGSVHIEDVNAGTMAVELTSSGNLVIDRGEVEELRLRLSSSGEYDGESVICQNADVTLTSSGDATLNVQGTLTADLSSSGNVYYRGNPKVVYKDSSSTGRVLPAP